jgi:hypothetical protein
MISLSLVFLVGCSAEYGLKNDPAPVNLYAGLEVDRDIDGDGVPDLNIDADGDGIPEVNIDLDGDGVPDVNIDLDGDAEPDLNIDSDFDGVADTNLDIDGDNRPDENLLDTFIIGDVSNVDIVFYGDTSGSMEAELSVMGARVNEFTQRLSDAGGDWQLIAINGDEGCAVDTLFTPGVPDWANRFGQALLSLPANEDTDEQGLRNAALAVENAGPGECNEGLLRPNALVHVIFLSDENDESPGYDAGNPSYWMDYVDRVIDAKNGVQGLTRFSAIAGATPDGCEGADPGFGYVDAVTGTGGAFLSICDPWEEQLDVLAQASVVLNEFALTVLPDPATIAVTANGMVVAPGGWTYDPVANTISFVLPLPTGTAITVAYEAL